MVTIHALDIPEIRTTIANFLPKKDLTSCSRVSRDWRDSFTILLYRHVVLSNYGPSIESIESNKHFIRQLEFDELFYKESAWISVQQIVISTIISDTRMSHLILENKAYGPKKHLMGPNGAKALSKALMVNTTLTTLELPGNSIGRNGAKALSKALKLNSSLTTLNLTNNSIDFSGIQALSEALKSNSTLSTLDLSQNSINVNGALALSNALKINSALTDLNLYMNRISDIGAEALLDTLKTYSTLIKIELGDNGIEQDIDQVLLETFKSNSTLTQLSLVNNSIGDSDACAISDALKVNRLWSA